MQPNVNGTGPVGAHLIYRRCVCPRPCSGVRARGDACIAMNIACDRVPDRELRHVHGIPHLSTRVAGETTDTHMTTRNKRSTHRNGRASGQGACTQFEAARPCGPVGHRPPTGLSTVPQPPLRCHQPQTLVPRRLASGHREVARPRGTVSHRLPKPCACIAITGPLPSAPTPWPPTSGVRPRAVRTAVGHSPRPASTMLQHQWVRG